MNNEKQLVFSNIFWIDKYNKIENFILIILTNIESFVASPNRLDLFWTFDISIISQN